MSRCRLDLLPHALATNNAGQPPKTKSLLAQETRTRKLFSLPNDKVKLRTLVFKLHMTLRATIFCIVVAINARAFAQETVEQPTPLPTPTATPTAVVFPSGPVIESTPGPHKRGWFSRMLHPFSGSSDKGPKYQDKRLRGLVLDVQVSPQPAKLSEVRQLDIKATLSNTGKLPVTLDFPNDQRVEIQLLSTMQEVLTKWSDNHAISEKPGTLIVNPGEHVEYKETISTRDLTPGKVFVAEVFFPKYPDLRARQKFLTEP
jgi:hypothetical protein